jgi:hypothetical protein
MMPLPTMTAAQVAEVAQRESDLDRRVESLTTHLLNCRAPMPPVANFSKAAARVAFRGLMKVSYANTLDASARDVTMACAKRGPMRGALKLGAKYSMASNFFQLRNRRRCGGYSKLSPHSAWTGVGLTRRRHRAALTKVVKSTLRLAKKPGSKLTPYSFNGGLRLGNATYTAAQFKVTHAAAIYDKYLRGTPGFVMDVCMGWGDRLAAFFACAHATVLVGCDPNPAPFGVYLQQCRAYDRWRFEVLHAQGENAREDAEAPSYPEPKVVSMADRFTFQSQHEKKYVAAVCFPAEDLPWDELPTKFDLVMTSPPYFDTERYAADASAAAVAEQSWSRYSTIREWHRQFLLPVVEQASSKLARGGHLCLNIVHAKHTKASDEKTTDVLHAWANGAGSGVTFLGFEALLTKGPPRRNGTIDAKRCEPLWVWKKE